jgi:hypothetical protein
VALPVFLVIVAMALGTAEAAVKGPFYLVVIGVVISGADLVPSGARLGRHRTSRMLARNRPERERGTIPAWNCPALNSDLLLFTYLAAASGNASSGSRQHNSAGPRES